MRVWMRDRKVQKVSLSRAIVIADNVILWTGVRCQDDVLVGLKI